MSQFFRSLPASGVGFFLFGLKQASACLFGGIILGLIVVSRFIEFEMISRYDFLFLSFLFIQILLIALKLEKTSEAKTILLFHIVGTAMEVFKTSEGIGSWSYPEASIFRIGNVPLFSGFMYAAIGSYMARVWRIFKFRFTDYPKLSHTIILAVLIYVNFFSHHYIWDFRGILFVVVAFLFWKTKVFFTIDTKELAMPLLLSFSLVSFFIWLAENIGTYFRAWLYPTQIDGWHMVSFGKFGAWFLLMIISFVMVYSLHYKRAKK